MARRNSDIHSASEERKRLIREFGAPLSDLMLTIA
jgi:hypothetical protein